MSENFGLPHSKVCSLGFWGASLAPQWWKPIPSKKSLTVYLLLALLLWLNLDWYTKGATAIKTWVWRNGVDAEVSMYGLEEKSSLCKDTGHDLASWNQKPDLSYTLHSSCWRSGPALAGLWGQGWSQMQWLAGHWFAGQQPLGGRGTLGQGSEDQKLSAESTFTCHKVVAKVGGHRLSWREPGPSRETMGAMEPESGFVCGNARTTNGVDCGFSEENYASFRAHLCRFSDFSCSLPWSWFYNLWVVENPRQCHCNCPGKVILG